VDCFLYDITVGFFGFRRVPGVTARLCSGRTSRRIQLNQKLKRSPSAAHALCVGCTAGLIGSVLSWLVGFLLTTHSVAAKPVIFLDLGGRQQSCLLDVRI
jgi:hypothetical protein